MLSSPVRPPTRRVAGAVAAALAVAIGVSACGSSPHAAAPPSFATASATLGPLRISGAYIPKPASPAVAAAYFTVRDDGPADALTAVSSTASRDVGLHQTVEHGNVGEMVPVASMPVAAGGSLTLAPGGYHVMLMKPTALTLGQLVPVTLRFAHAGSVTLQVPVVPLTATNDDSASMSMTDPGMGS